MFGRDMVEVILHGDTFDDASHKAHEYADLHGMAYIPPFNDPKVIEGQGTVGLEIAKSDVSFDALITCMGGGGLCAGISLAMNELSPQTKIFGAEPEHYNDHQQSFEAGKRVALQTMPPSLCDALMTPEPGALTWSINSKSLSGVSGVSDLDCLMSMAIAKKELGVQLEPGGAVAMAALLKGALADKPDIKTICIILSGGNVDPEVARRADELLG